MFIWGFEVYLLNLNICSGRWWERVRVRCVSIVRLSIDMGLFLSISCRKVRDAFWRRSMEERLVGDGEPL